MGRQARQADVCRACVPKCLNACMARQHRRGCERVGCLLASAKSASTGGAPWHAHACMCAKSHAQRAPSHDEPGSGLATPPLPGTAALLLPGTSACLRTVHMRRPPPPLPSCWRRELQWLFCCLGHPCGGGGPPWGPVMDGTFLKAGIGAGRYGMQRAVRAGGKGGALWARSFGTVETQTLSPAAFGMMSRLRQRPPGRFGWPAFHLATCVF